MINIRLLISLFIIAFHGVVSSSETIYKAAQSLEELQTQLENVLESMHVPGMSVAIVDREAPLFVTGLGKSDLANDRFATAETLFRIGSVSKSFVALAVLKLVGEGKLSLDDSVRKLAPRIWFSNRWEESDPIRVVHLLENTTGWDDMHLREFANDSSMSLIEALDYDHSSRTSRWPPGTRMAYCNSGPAVAAYIVEKISGISFEEYIKENFFKPIGMQSTTYLQPDSELATTLYYRNGKTAHNYWNIMYRPVGSINTSANDMANYLLFYLNRGNINGHQVLDATSIERMQNPSSTWAAKEGLLSGYGLHNYSTMYDGFIYHGHDGHLPGGHAAMAYFPKEGVGYFYSINSDNLDAFTKIGGLIRGYIARNLEKPISFPAVLMPEKATSYTGWYEPDSPRMQMFAFLERLIGLSYVYVEDNKLLVTSLSEQNAEFFAVNESEFLYVPKDESQDSLPTLKLIEPNKSGQFIHMSLGLRNLAFLNITMKHIPTWLAIFQIISVGFVLTMFMITLIYAPFLIFRLLNKNYAYSDLSVLLWPLIAVLSLVSIVVICMLCGDLYIQRLGNLTVWSFSLFLATMVFATASIMSVILTWRFSKVKLGVVKRSYSVLVTFALMLTTTYFGYWGIIGLRTWV